jgi:hypothetical protein
MGVPEYFIGTGDLHASKLDASGNPTTFRNVGECPVFEFNPTAEYADNFRTGKTGPNLQDLHVVVKQTAQVMAQIKERTAENLEILAHGTVISEAAGSMSTPFALQAGILANDVILLPGDHVGITALVLKDSAGSPATLDNTKYTFDGESKLITFLDVTSLTQPIKVFSYSYKKSTGVSLLSQALPDLCLIFDGTNLAVPGEKIWARIDRVSFPPAAKIALKSGSATGTANQAEVYELNGVALLLPGKLQSDGLGTIRTY